MTRHAYLSTVTGTLLALLNVNVRTELPPEEPYSHPANPLSPRRRSEHQPRYRQPLELNLRIRRPHWAADNVQLAVNGKPHPVAASPGQYIAIERTWKTGDQINLTMPMKLHIEAMPDNSNKITFFYGPVLLAGALGKEGIENLDPHAEERAKFDHIVSVTYCYNATWILPAGVSSCCISSCGSPDEYKRSNRLQGHIGESGFAFCALPATSRSAAHFRRRALLIGGRACGGWPSACWQPKGDKRDILFGHVEAILAA